MPLTYQDKEESLNAAYELRKITRPPLSPAILHRELLVRHLNEVITGTEEGISRYKLVLLHAPAGYGKTTLLADFARHTATACCWYFLDSTDADKLIFLKRLLASVRHRFPQFGLTFDPLLASAASTTQEDITSSHYETIVDAFINIFEREISERFALILCNYQEINECQEVNEIVNLLLQKLPAQCVVVIESRATPHLEFVSLFARREMVGIGSKQLQFTAQQVRELARLQGVVSLSEDEAERLARSFEGWITGILLGTRLGGFQLLHQRDNKHPFSRNQELPVEREHLFSYVVNEVFNRMPEVFAFLKNASILREMIPSVCTELLGITDAKERLHSLEQNGLFVTRREEKTQVSYICHPILRELLYSEFRRELPDRFVMLHRRAVELWSARLDYDQAIYHAFEAKADNLAILLIFAAYEQMLTQGYIESLARYIDMFPPATLTRYPRLMLIRAHIYLLVGEHTRGLSLLDEMSKAISQHAAIVELEDLPLLQIESTILRSKALFQRGDYKQAQELCQQVQERLPADEIRLRVEIHTRLGICANLTGQYIIGIAQLQKALQLWGRHTIGYQTAEIHGALASTYSLIGNFALAEHHIARATTCWEQLHDERGKINNVIRFGLIKRRQGAFSEAEDAFTQALNQAQTFHLQRVQAYALFNMGELYQHQELYEKSLTLLENGLNLARQVKDQYLINCTLCGLAMTYLYMGDSTTALLIVSEVEVQTNTNKQPGYEYVIRELAYGTILLHQHHCEEAYSHLSALETPLTFMELKQEQFQMTLRLAVCLLEQGRTGECASYIEEVATQLRLYSDYKYLVLLELRHQPELREAIARLPAMAGLRELLQLTEVQEAKIFSEPEQALPSPPTTAGQQIAVTNTNHEKIVIRAFGEPSVIIQERAVTRWRMARSMELFFFLLDRGSPTRKEQIITALWSEVDEQINHNFHSTFYYLRKALDAPFIVSQGSTYFLDLTSYYGDNVWYDVAAFQQHRARAKEAREQEGEFPLREALLAMVELYQGDYVQPFYSDWCTLRRDELRRAYLEARQELAVLAWRNEQFDESMGHWQHMLATDNCLEEAHYGLMRYYVRQGKRSLALRQYQRCRDMLQSEMGIQPGNAMQNLYQRLTGHLVTSDK